MHSARPLPCRSVRLVAGSLAVASTMISTVAGATARPDPLSEVAGCERWTGSADGNDPTVQLDVRLCPEGDQVTGQVQWSSLRSGWNLREVTGAWSADGKTLTLKDMRIIEEKPNPGWRFCTIDRYALQRAGADGLTGSYHSSACRDEAQVKLRRAPRPEGSAPSPDSSNLPPRDTASATAAPPLETSSAAAPKAPTADATKGGCGSCSTQSSSEPPASVWLLAPLVLLRRRKRSSAD